MVGGLHRDGLRVVLDQVFNHTAASGQDAKSVLDKIVPGYYQPPERGGRGRDVHLLPERRHRAPDGAEAHGGRRRAVGP